MTKLELNFEELTLVKAMLIGILQEHNRMIEKDLYIASEQKEVFEIAKNLINKVED